VRQAHGNRAAAELAVQICAEYPEPPKPVPLSAAAPQSAGSQSPAASEATSVSRSPHTQTAAPLEKAKNESVSQSTPVKASEKNPYFAHLAMCTEGDPPPVQPPLGWVLSNATQKAFGKLLTQCGNDQELSQLEIALGRQMR
jgi:hypothetical protein